MHALDMVAKFAQAHRVGVRRRGFRRALQRGQHRDTRTPKADSLTNGGGTLFPTAFEAAHLPLVEKIENEFELAGFVLVDPFYVDSIEDIVARTMIVRHKERKFGLGCVDRWRKQHDQLFERFVGLIAPAERTLSEQAFLFGDSPVYADFSLFGVLENVTYRGYIELPDSLVSILRWREELRSFRYPA